MTKTRITEALGDRLVSVEKIPLERGNKGYIYYAKCPKDGCDQSVQIRTLNDVNFRLCFQHGIKKRSRKQERKIYELVTEDPFEASSRKARENPDQFLFERRCLETKVKHSMWKCCMDDCFNAVTQLGCSCRPCRHELLRKRPFEYLYNTLKTSAPRRKSSGFVIEVLMTYEEFVILCKQDACHYCETPLIRHEYNIEVRTHKKYAIMLDRKDSDDHYTFANCVPCCSHCNRIKGPYLDYEEMLLIMSHRKNKKAG